MPDAVPVVSSEPQAEEQLPRSASVSQQSVVSQLLSDGQTVCCALAFRAARVCLKAAGSDEVCKIKVLSL